MVSPTRVLSGDNVMSLRRLGHDDRRAVDLLLERPTEGGDTPTVNQVFAAPVRGSFEKRIEAVEKILNLLNELPEAEPPAYLVSRTLARIEEYELNPTGARPQEEVDRLRIPRSLMTDVPSHA